MRLLLALPFAAAACAGAVSFASSTTAGPQIAPTEEFGAELFAIHCASCHGVDGEGVDERGPTLEGEGEASADFVLRTGRMPIAQPNIQAKRGPVRFTEDEIVALVAHVTTIGDGPRTPDVDAAAGDVPNGGVLYRLNCAACHVASGSGAAIGGDRKAPDLMQATPTQVGQAIVMGPGAMPVFGSLSAQDINDTAAYVVELQALNEEERGRNFGGAGPVAEGLAAWLLGLIPLVALTRWIGSPHAGRDEGANPELDAEGEVVT